MKKLNFLHFYFSFVQIHFYFVEVQEWKTATTIKKVQKDYFVCIFDFIKKKNQQI